MARLFDAPDGRSGHLYAQACDLEREIIETGVTTAQALTAKIKFIRATQHDDAISTGYWNALSETRRGSPRERLAAT